MPSNCADISNVRYEREHITLCNDNFLITLSESLLMLLDLAAHLSTTMEDQALERLESIRRWPGDELDQHKLSFATGETPHFTFVDAGCPIQQKLTELFGGWSVDCRCQDMNDEMKEFFLDLPFSMQNVAAHKLANFTAAGNHLFDVCEQDEPKFLLKRVGAGDAVKFGRRSFLSWVSDAKVPQHGAAGPGGMTVDANDFISLVPSHHGINMILARLVTANEASDENLRALFGSEMHVLGALLEVQELMRVAASEGSAAQKRQQQLFDESALRPLLSCAHCLKVPTDQKVLKCGNCQREVFCCKDCLKAEWPIHQLDCARVQGKPITQAMINKAEALRRQRLVTTNAEAGRKDVHCVQAMLDSVMGDEAEPAFSTLQVFTAHGERRRKDLSYYYLEALQSIAHTCVQLKYEMDISVMMNPAGAEGNRFAVFTNPDNGAFILLSFQKLFDNGGDGNFHGICVDDVFVVKTKVPVSNALALKLQKAKQACSGEVEWKSVPRPVESGEISSSWKLIVAWLAKAKELAVIPTKDLFYHVGSARKMKNSFGFMGP